MERIEVTPDVLANLDEIDDHYRKAKSVRLSRFDIAWGEWSGEFNRSLREKIEARGPQDVLYQYLFNYWMNRSLLLELHHKSRLFKVQQKRELGEQGADIKTIIRTGEIPGDDVPQTPEEFVKEVLNGQ